MAGEVVIETRCLWCSDNEVQCHACHAANAPTVVGIFDRQPVAGALRDVEEQPFKNEVVEILEGLLQRARAGDFTGFAGVLNGPNDMTVIATMGAIDDPIIFLGGLSRVAHRINTEVDLDED